MTLEQLKNRLATEKRFTGSLWIICGEKIESPGILGIYEEDGCWNIYHTDDRGEIVVFDHGSEEEMTDALYYGFFGAGNNVNYKWLKDNGCWPDGYPAGVPLKPEVFIKVLKEGKIDVQNVIVDKA